MADSAPKRFGTVKAFIPGHLNPGGKNRYVSVGSALRGSDGRLIIKLDAMPVSPGWEGWLNIFEDSDDRTDS